MNDIIHFLRKYAWEHNVGVELKEQEDSDILPFSSGDHNMVFMNMNWKNQNEIPFQFAHEISHILNGDKGINSFSTNQTDIVEENLANRRGIQILIEYAEKNDLHFNSCVCFMDMFGIPSYLQEVVNKELQILYNSSNELFELN